MLILISIMWLKIAAITILALFAVPQNPTDTVAVILSPDSPTEIILKSEAQAQFEQLCADGTDDRRLVALAAALNPMPDWAQLVMNKEASVCNRNPKPIVPIPIEKQSGR